MSWAAELAVAACLGIAAAPWQPRASTLDGWTLVKTADDGLTVESREVPGSNMPELRITTTAPSTPRALGAAAWELRDEGVQALYLERRVVLSETARERHLFLDVRPPILNPRQCVLHQQRWVDPSTGVVHQRFSRLPVAPSSAEALPFAQLRGEWRFAARPGGAQVVYVVLIDLGGVPAWLASGPQLDAAVATVREVIDRARQLELTPACQKERPCHLAD